MPVVRVSAYEGVLLMCIVIGLNTPANQYGPHQYWISHSGLAGCPPAAYSNIVSRIVIIGAKLWPKSPLATQYSQRKIFHAFHFITKASGFIFWPTSLRGRGAIAGIVGEFRRRHLSPRSAQGEKKKQDEEKAMEGKPKPRPKNKLESVP